MTRGMHGHLRTEIDVVTVMLFSARNATVMVVVVQAQH